MSQRIANEGNVDNIKITDGGNSAPYLIVAVTGKSDTIVRKEITKTQAIRERRATHPDETQQATADAVGCTQARVAQVISESSDSEQLLIIPTPSWITHQDLCAAFRKLPADERARLEALPENERRGSVRAAAIQAGIIRVPTKLQLAQKAFVRLSGDDRLEFIAWLTIRLATHSIAHPNAKP